MRTPGIILRETLSRLWDLYGAESLYPGKLLRVGLKPGWNAVIGSDGQCGMAMSFTGWEAVFGKPRLDLDKLKSFVGRDLFAVAEEYLVSDSWQERAIGVAALSALSQPLLTPSSLAARGFDVLGDEADFASQLRPNDVAVVIGYGGGVKRLLEKCREIHVTDMRPREAFQTVVIGDGVYYSPAGVYVHSDKENASVLRLATAVSITGSTLVNGTLEELLSHVVHARLVAMYGPSVSIIPDVLFEYGVHLVQTYRISDRASFESGVLNDLNMEAVIHGTQQPLAVVRRSSRGPL